MKIKFSRSEILSQNSCPVCGGLGDLKYINVQDKLFGVDGDWNYLECKNCTSLYLGNVPRKEYIAKAYKNYYTHNVNNETFENEQRVEKSPLIGFKKEILRKKIFYFIRSNLNILKQIFPGFNYYIDYYDRYIAKITNPESLIVELGCGNGAFIKKMQDKGRVIHGIEFDNESVDICKKAGLNVHNTNINDFIKKNGKIDYLILHHVIEHIHEPQEFLKTCYDSIRDNGKIWIETPNFNSKSAYIFKSYWRGLEPPRHLQIFNLNSLIKMLELIGFKVLIFPKRPSPFKFMITESMKVAARSNICFKDRLMIVFRLFKSMMVFHKTNNTEFITVIVTK